MSSETRKVETFTFSIANPKKEEFIVPRIGRLLHVSYNPHNDPNNPFGWGQFTFHIETESGGDILFVDKDGVETETDSTEFLVVADGVAFVGNGPRYWTSIDTTIGARHIYEIGNVKTREDLNHGKS